MSDGRDLIEELQALEREAAGLVEQAGDEAALEAVRVRYLGRKDGRISRVLRGLGTLPPEARPRVGAEANRVKSALQGAIEGREALLSSGVAGGEGLDLTLPGRRPWA